jgi:hypothetical protein
MVSERLRQAAALAALTAILGGLIALGVAVAHWNRGALREERREAAALAGDWQLTHRAGGAADRADPADAGCTAEPAAGWRTLAADGRWSSADTVLLACDAAPGWDSVRVHVDSGRYEVDEAGEVAFVRPAPDPETSERRVATGRLLGDTLVVQYGAVEGPGADSARAYVRRTGRRRS